LRCYKTLQNTNTTVLSLLLGKIYFVFRITLKMNFAPGWILNFVLQFAVCSFSNVFLSRVLMYVGLFNWYQNSSRFIYTNKHPLNGVDILFRFIIILTNSWHPNVWDLRRQKLRNSVVYKFLSLKMTNIIGELKTKNWDIQYF